jgi:exopolysaccharide biosynthesis WecB/TagA/CpsF family protein
MESERGVSGAQAAAPRPDRLASIDGAAVNVATLAQATRRAADSAARGEGFTLFTLNLDHLVKLREDAAFARAYAEATFVTADGWPVAWLARRQGATQVERATGADLVEPLCEEAARLGVGVHFFGSSPATLSKAAQALTQRHPGLVVAGMEAPPMGFDPLSPAADAAADRIAASGASLCFVAFGAPKQEVFAARMARRHPGVGFVCIGAALDFIAGEKARAPALFQRTGMEWAWRLMSEPRRMAGRYTRCAVVFADVALRGSRREGEVR